MQPPAERYGMIALMPLKMSGPPLNATFIKFTSLIIFWGLQRKHALICSPMTVLPAGTTVMIAPTKTGASRRCRLHWLKVHPSSSQQRELQHSNERPCHPPECLNVGQRCSNPAGLTFITKPTSKKA